MSFTAGPSRHECHDPAWGRAGPSTLPFALSRPQPPSPPAGTGKEDQGRDQDQDVYDINAARLDIAKRMEAMKKTMEIKALEDRLRELKGA